MSKKGESRCLNCGKIIDSGKYCNEECLKEYDAKIQGNNCNGNGNIKEVENILSYIGINKESFGKSHAYNNWVTFVGCLIKWNGKSWNELIKPRCRSKVGIGERYLEEYLNSLIAWEVVKLVDGRVVLLDFMEDSF